MLGAARTPRRSIVAVNGELFDHLNSVVSISEKKARRIMNQVLDMKIRYDI